MNSFSIKAIFMENLNQNKNSCVTSRIYKKSLSTKATKHHLSVYLHFLARLSRVPHEKRKTNTTNAPQVQSRNSVDYASSGNGEASCDSSLVSCCSVYEDPCAQLPDDMRLAAAEAGQSCGSAQGGEGTSEGGSESSSIAGSVSAHHQRVQKRANGPQAQPKKKLTTQ